MNAMLARNLEIPRFLLAILVAPLFAAEQHPDYQRLGRVGRGKRADIALNLIVAEVAAITGASAERFCIFG